MRVVAADEVVPVVASFGQPHQVARRNPQLGTGERRRHRRIMCAIQNAATRVAIAAASSRVNCATLRTASRGFISAISERDTMGTSAPTRSSRDVARSKMARAAAFRLLSGSSTASAGSRSAALFSA